MTDTQEHIDSLLAGCERQAEAWEKIQPAEFDITEPFRDEKYKILHVNLGYIGRMLELYHDTKLALEDDRLLSAVILARASVESSAMMCLFHEQMKKHFWPSPSPDCMRIIERHSSGGRHKVSESENERVRSFHISEAIRVGNEFAKRTNRDIRSFFHFHKRLRVSHTKRIIRICKVR